MATYTASNAIKKITTGDESGSWGNSTNNNFDIIDRAANGFVSIALSGTSYTLALSTTAVLSNGHYKAIKFTGTPGGTCTVTLEQNDKARMYMILNSTNQSLSITQGSGANVTILAGKSAIILADGAGSGAAVTDFTSLVSISELDGITAGTVTASKSVVVDSNKDITGFRNVDIDGTLEADAITVNGSEGTTVQYANCCHAIAGDFAHGQMLGGAGLSIHRKVCNTAIRQRKKDPSRWTDVIWGEPIHRLFVTHLRLEVEDTPGTLAIIASAITSADGNIVDISVLPNQGSILTILKTSIEVKNRQHLAAILRQLRRTEKMYKDIRV